MYYQQLWAKMFQFIHSHLQTVHISALTHLRNSSKTKLWSVYNKQVMGLMSDSNTDILFYSCSVSDPSPSPISSVVLNISWVCFLISISGYIPHPFVHVAYTLNTLAELFYIPSLIIPASLLCLTLCLLCVFRLVSGHGALL